MSRPGHTLRLLPGGGLLDWDFHTHTIYSKHAHPEMTVANSLAAASAAGLKRLVILEHVPEISVDRNTVAQWKKGRDERAQLDAIAEDLKEIEASFPSVKVLRGVELDADPLALDGSAMLKDLSGIDIVLGSTHVFPGGAAFWFDKVTLPPERGWEIAQEWAAWTERFVRSGVPHVLSHPGDLVAARQLVPPFDEERTLELFDPLLAAMAECGVAFELNELLGAKLPPDHRDSYPALVRRARGHRLKFSIGSDAHSPAGIGKFNWVIALIEAAGVTSGDLWQPKSLES